MKTVHIFVSVVISLSSCASYIPNPQGPSLGEEFANGFLFGLGGGAAMTRPAPAPRSAQCTVMPSPHGDTITCY